MEIKITLIIIFNLQLRSENKQLQNSNDYLKNNMEKIQKDLDDARHSLKVSQRLQILFNHFSTKF